MTWDSLFGRMTGKQNKKRTLKAATWQTTTDDVMFEGIKYAKGSQYKVWETENFGWVCFHPSSLTPEGYSPGRFIHKF